MVREAQRRRGRHSKGEGPVPEDSANILPALIHRAIIAFFYNFRKTQKFSHRFQNEIGKEWNNILTFQDKHDQLRVRYKER